MLSWQIAFIKAYSRAVTLWEAELNTPESFGSWYRDYIRSDRRVRLIWDDRDQWFVLQGGKQWHDLAVRRPSELADGIDEFLTHVD